jgi:MurNAc alpha-1-phosphate uridylyltransferase
MREMPYSVMIFAAGRGERMRPLTDETPKPLILLAGKPMIVWQIEALARAGFHRVVINTAWQGQQFPALLGDGAKWGVSIVYSHEGGDPASALETRGGIVEALPLIGDRAFLTVSGDIYTAFEYDTVRSKLEAIERGDADAHFVLANNPDFHPEGDFAIRDGLATREGQRLNYANIACWHPKLFRGLPPKTKSRLFPWADEFVSANRVTAEHFAGEWENIGTPEQLAALDARLRAKMSV